MIRSRHWVASGIVLVSIASCSLWHADKDPTKEKQTVSQGGSTGGSSAGTAGGSSAGTAGDMGTQEVPTFTFPVPEGPVQLEDWAVGSAKAVCALVDRCMGSFLSWGNYQPYEEPCVDFVARRLRDRVDLESLVAEGDLAYDPVSFGACLTEYASSVCSEGEPVQCLRRLGTLAEGAPCSVDFQCQPNLQCQRSRECTTGTCTLRLSAGAACAENPTESDLTCGVGLICWQGLCRHRSMSKNGLCNEENSGCTLGLHCAWDELCGDSCYSCRLNTSFGNADCPDGQALDYAYEFPDCRMGPSLGEPCFHDDDCGYDNYCSNISPELSTKGLCVARAALGKPCNEADPSQSCKQGARCDTTTFTCVDASLTSLADKCSKNEDCYSDRCVSGDCVRPQLCEADLVR